MRTLALFWLLYILSAHVVADTGRTLIAAASDLQFALSEIASAFESETGERVDIAYGSSGNFSRLLQQGAPYDLFFSADERYVEDLNRAGLTRDNGTVYAVGRLVMITPQDSGLKVDASLTDLAAALDGGRLVRFAIANPDHAPYGMRAQEVLRKLGLWDTIQPYLVLGENVSQAAQFATSADTQGGLIAYSLALSEEVSKLGHFVLVPEQYHSPLRQRMVLLNNADNVAEEFFNYMQTDTARRTMQRYGFKQPGSEQ